MANALVNVSHRVKTLGNQEKSIENSDLTRNTRRDKCESVLLRLPVPAAL